MYKGTTNIIRKQILLKGSLAFIERLVLFCSFCVKLPCANRPGSVKWDVFLVHATHYCESQNSQSNNLTSHILIGDLMVAV